MFDGLVHLLAVQVSRVEDDSSKQLWLTGGQALCLSHLIMCFSGVVLLLPAASVMEALQWWSDIIERSEWCRGHYQAEPVTSIIYNNKLSPSVNISLFVTLPPLCPYMVFPAGLLSSIRVHSSVAQCLKCEDGLQCHWVRADCAEV